MPKLLIILCALITVSCAAAGPRAKTSPAPKKDEVNSIIAAQYYGLADVAMREGAAKSALEYYLAALDYDPSSVEIRQEILTTLNILSQVDSTYTDQFVCLATAYCQVEPVTARMYSSGAVAFSKGGNYDIALLYIQHALELEPTATNYYHAYLVSSQAGKNNKAAAYLQQAMQSITPQKPELAGMIASSVYRLNQPNVTAQLQELYQKVPQPEVLEILAQAMYQHKNLEGLFPLIEQATANQQPMPEQLPLVLLQHYLESKNYEAIIKNARVFMDIDAPAVDKPLLAASFALKDFQLATELLERLLEDGTLTEQERKDYNDYLLWSRLNLNQVQAAAKLYIEQPDFASINSMLKDFATNQDTNININGFFDALQNLNYQQAQLLTLKALYKDFTNNQDDAKAILTSLKNLPADSVAVIRSTMLWLKYQQPEQAREMYTKIEPDSTFNNFALSYYLVSKNYQAALPMAVQKFGKQNTPNAYQQLAYVYEKSGDIDTALQTLEQGVKQFGNDANMLNSLGYTLLTHNRQLTKADSLLHQALALNPDALNIQDSVAWLYYLQGNYNKALQAMQPNIDKGVDSSSIAYHLGAIYQALAQPQQALQYYNLAIDLNNDVNDVQLAQQALLQMQKDDR